MNGDNMNIIEKLMLRLISHRVSHWFDMERSLAKIDHSNKSTELSPIKSWPDPEKIPTGNEVPFNLKNIPIVGKHLKNSISEGMKAIRSINENPSTVKDIISPDDLKEFEALAKEQASHPLGGLTLYPPLAVEAGLVQHSATQHRQ